MFFTENNRNLWDESTTVRLSVWTLLLKGANINLVTPKERMSGKDMAISGDIQGILESKNYKQLFQFLWATQRHQNSCQFSTDA